MNQTSDIEMFYNLFPNPELARDLTNILEDYRIESRLKSEYPALGDQISEINIFMLSKRPFLNELSNDKQKAVEVIGQRLISGETNEAVPVHLKKTIDYALAASRFLDRPSADIHEVARIATELYLFIDETFKDAYQPVTPFSTVLDQSKYNQYIENFEGASNKTGTPARDQQNKSAGSESESISDQNEAEHQKEENQPQSSGTRRKEGDSNIYDFNQMPIAQQTDLPADPESKENVKKSVSVSFNENGLRPKDMASKFDSPAPDSIGDHLIHLTPFIADKRELESTPGTYLYSEWGNDIGCYRINWSRVREHALKGNSTKFYQATLVKYAGLIKKVKREFQMLRPEGLTKLKRQLDGDEIDLDSTVEYFIDRKLGITPSEKNYIRTKKNTRDIAVSFLVDMSGSTRGSTITLEKESLVIMSEALCELGDTFSIYGFSGHTRKNVDFYIIKDFSDVYDHKTAENISSIEDKYSTRIGPAVRHATTKLIQRDEKIKMLILLSDGKPEDKEYDDSYGIEDTRMALKEGQKYGIRPFCITVDNKAPEYLHRMYSHSNWVVINDVSKLPLKITRIYKRLTT